MSHTATILIQVKCRAAFEKACKRLKIEYSLNESVELFDGTKVTGMTARLKGWRYPVVFSEGNAHFDNYGGRWGEESELNKFRQVYAAEAAAHKARQQGFRVSETKLKDGTIRLVCQR